MKNDGTLVSSSIRPNGQNDTYATAWSNDIKGGHHTYQTYNEMLNISLERRQWGMIVTIMDDEKTYQLKPVINNSILDNNNWADFSSGSIEIITNDSWLDVAIDIIDILPNNPNDGDRYVISDITSSPQLTGRNNNIATYTTQFGWLFDTPKESQAINIISRHSSIYKYSVSSNIWIPYNIGAIAMKYVIDAGETVIVPEKYQYLIYGDLTVIGTIINYGRVTVMNGAIINQNNITNLGGGVTSIVNV